MPSPQQKIFGADEAQAFWQLIRDRRKALGMRQEDVIFATGVGRRYLIDLEAGKPTAWIGPALGIARFLGVSFHAQPTPSGEGDFELPELEDDNQQDDGHGNADR